MNEAMLLQKTEMLIKQVEDLSKYINDGDMIAFVNFQQRRRFIAATYAMNWQEAIERLYHLELGDIKHPWNGYCKQCDRTFWNPSNDNCIYCGGPLKVEAPAF